jgi:hypothetical protein
MWEIWFHIKNRPAGFRHTQVDRIKPVGRLVLRERHQLAIILNLGTIFGGNREKYFTCSDSRRFYANRLHPRYQCATHRQHRDCYSQPNS